MRYFRRALCASVPLLSALNYQPKDRCLDNNDALICHDTDYQDTIKSCSTLIKQAKLSCGTPGVAISVHVNGEKVWEDGFGYADVENAVLCTPSTVMRIASISKLITSVIAMKMYQNSKLDLDQNISTICEDMPEFSIKGEPKEITTRQLLNHTSGIRHYIGADDSDSGCPEFYSSEHFNTVKDALAVFANDDLQFEPGSDFCYTTFGYSVLSYVIETVSEKGFPKVLKDTFNQFGMFNTYCEFNDELILNRAKFYQFENNKLKNSPYVDNSIKWAGGGLLSTVKDLSQLGNIFLYCLQSNDPDNYLSQDTLQIMTKRYNEFNEFDHNRHYSLGVRVQKDMIESSVEVLPASFHHTGGAVGAVSNLFILPTEPEHESDAPRGVVVVILCNLESGGPVIRLAREIAVRFRDAVCSCEECDIEQ